MGNSNENSKLIISLSFLFIILMASSTLADHLLRLRYIPTRLKDGTIDSSF